MAMMSGLVHAMRTDSELAASLRSTPPARTALRLAVRDAAIWQRDPAGRWHIAVDISTPLPPGRDESRGGPASYGYRT